MNQMNVYVSMGMNVLFDLKKDLKDFNELSIYLAKQPNPDALKTLKLLILASEYYWPNDLDINSIRKYKIVTSSNYVYNRNESIVGNLSSNPQNIGLELMDLIIHNYDVNLEIRPNDASWYTITDIMAFSFSEIEKDQNTFYKRYDMVDKRLDIINYLIDNELINARQKDNINKRLKICIKYKYGYTEAQLLKMQIIIAKLNLQNNVSNLIRNKELFSRYDKNETIRQLLKSNEDSSISNDRRRLFFNELEKYVMEENQLHYMMDTISPLVKKKIIQ